MNILSWLRRKFSAERLQGRTPAGTIRVRLSDHQTHDTYFVRLKKWSEFHPVFASWALPDQADQEQRYEEMILAMVRAGGVDGLVPDMMDRLISDEMDQTRQRVEQEHVWAKKQLTYYYEQAKVAVTELWVKISRKRDELAEAEQGYAAAFEELTGREAPTSVTQRPGATPVIISTQAAPREVSWVESASRDLAPSREVDD